nr:hypothetical protein [Sodalis-like endosymbiont of Proechinophthirus fluctus]
MVGLSDLTQPSQLFAMLSFIVIVVLESRRLPISMLIGTLATTFLLIAMDINPFASVISIIPSIAPTFLQLDIRSALGCIADKRHFLLPVCRRV